MRQGSGSEMALRYALQAAKGLGASTELFSGPDLALPHYEPGRKLDHPIVTRLISELSRADGLIVASPGYHGSISGLLKNVFDYMEEMRMDRDGGAPIPSSPPLSQLTGPQARQVTAPRLGFPRFIAPRRRPADSAQYERAEFPPQRFDFVLMSWRREPLLQDALGEGPKMTKSVSPEDERLASQPYTPMANVTADVRVAKNSTTLRRSLAKSIEGWIGVPIKSSG